MIDTIKKMDSDVDVKSLKNMNIKQLEFIIDYLKEYKYKLSIRSEHDFTK